MFGKCTAPEDQIPRIQNLRQQLINMGAPPNQRIANFTKSQWFASILMWIRIQRVIEADNMAARNKNQMQQGVRSNKKRKKKKKSEENASKKSAKRVQEFHSDTAMFV